MKGSEQRVLDSLNRSAEYIDTNIDVLGPMASSGSYKQLKSSVVTLNALSNQQGVAGLTIKGQVNLQAALAKQLKSQHMVPLATFARANLRGAPDYAAFTKPFKQLAGAALVRAARAMATAAAPHTDALTQSGFPADTIAQLDAAASALESAMTDHASARTGRVSATKGIKNELRSGREAVMVLHAIIARQFASDTAFSAGWNSARRVTAKIGAIRTPSTTPTLASPQAPSTLSPAGTAAAA